MRQVVEPRDVELFCGKSMCASYKMLQRIRTSLGKYKRAPITIEEFDAYCNLQHKSTIAKTIEMRDKKRAP